MHAATIGHFQLGQYKSARSRAVELVRLLLLHVAVPLPWPCPISHLFVSSWHGLLPSPRCRALALTVPISHLFLSSWHVSCHCMWPVLPSWRLAVSPIPSVVASFLHIAFHWHAPRDSVNHPAPRTCTPTPAGMPIHTAPPHTSSWGVFLGTGTLSAIAVGGA